MLDLFFVLSVCLRVLCGEKIEWLIEMADKDKDNEKEKGN